MKLRSHLILLVVVSLLPVLIFTGVMIFLSARQQRDTVDRGLLDTARALSLAVDRELEASIRALQTLGISEHLDSGDLRKFYEQAKRVLKAQGVWETIIVADPSGQQLLNLRLPFGSPLPRSSAPEMIKQVSETRQPAISNLFQGQIARRSLFGVDVPVIRDGKVKYVLTASSSPAFLVSLLSYQNIPSDWLSTIIDRNQVIIARTRDFEKFLGKPAAPSFAAKSKEAKEIAWRGVTLDGVDVYAAARRSDLSGWTVGLAVPVPAIEAPVRHSLMVTAVGGLILLLLGIVFATLLGRRIARPIATLLAAAGELGRGENPRIEPIAIVEVDQVARTIEDAAAKRQQAEEALRESEQRYRLIVETMNDIVYKIAITENDPFGGTVQFVSNQVENILGYRPDEFMQDPGLWFRILHPENVPGLVESSRKIITTGEVGIREYRIRHKETGEYRWVEDRVVPLIDDRGRLIGIQGVARDITERKQLQREILGIGERERERIGQDIHDSLGQHLTGVALMSKGLEHRLAARSLPEAADAAKIADLVNQAITRSRNLAEALYPVELERNGLISALEELASSVGTLLKISCQLEYDQGIVIYDNTVAINLYRIAQEAVHNAVKHGKAKQVLIKVATVDGRTVLSVSDDGVGFPQGFPDNQGMGLKIMKYRTALIQGSLDIRLGEHGGTIVTCSSQRIHPEAEIGHGDKSSE